MRDRWASLLVALGLIAIFYLIRKYYSKYSQKRSIKHSIKRSTHLQGLPLNARKLSGEFHASHKMIKKKSSSFGHLSSSSPSGSSTSSSYSSHPGSIVLHPHSLEVAKKEFVHYAHHFRGSYESLFLSCHGKVSGVYREQVLKSWEEAIRSTGAQSLILVWTTIVQKYCGRNFYRKGTNRLGWDVNNEHRILEDWLNQLLKWGLQRELCEQRSAEGENEAGSGGTQPRWTLNGEVIEVVEGRVKLLGH